MFFLKNPHDYLLGIDLSIHFLSIGIQRNHLENYQ